jgi:hypothetical protein
MHVGQQILCASRKSLVCMIKVSPPPRTKGVGRNPFVGPGEIHTSFQWCAVLLQASLAACKHPCLDELHALCQGRKKHVNNSSRTLFKIKIVVTVISGNSTIPHSTPCPAWGGGGGYSNYKITFSGKQQVGLCFVQQ